MMSIFIFMLLFMFKSWNKFKLNAGRKEIINKIKLSKKKLDNVRNLKKKFVYIM